MSQNNLRNFRKYSFSNQIFSELKSYLLEIQNFCQKKLKDKTG